MRILLITQAASVRRTWGITKVIIDASEAIRKTGVECDIFPPHSIDPSTYETQLREYLEKTKGTYDVIEIPDTLRYALNPREYAPLIVVRSVLLPLHRPYIHFPTRPTTFKSKLKELLIPTIREKQEQEQIRSELTIVRERLKEGHCINVANSKDKEVLIQEGYEANNILVLPYGLNDERFKLLNEIEGPSSTAGRTNLVFIGTFDFRKGCLDIVHVFREFHKSFPKSKLKLLGTRGLMTSKQQVLRFFPKNLRPYVDVVESFTEQELPDLLSDCDIGLFPSYWEGFGISVVEQLAAGIPVIAYNAPGPCDILPEKWLVESGQWEQMLKLLLHLADSRDPQEAKNYASKFRWTQIGEDTVKMYQKYLNEIETGS